MGYDIIGDIHGCDLSLAALLKKLGYTIRSGYHQHASRRVIFLGDFIDRGPGQREVLSMVRPMIDGGSALAVMGNHEFNAIAYATAKQGSGFLREHSEKNRKQHQAFLNAYEGEKDHSECIEWMSGLPLWLDAGGVRIVHACWDPRLIERLEAEHEGSLLGPGLLRAASDKDCWEHGAIETLLKGKEVALPDGESFEDKDGNRRSSIRVQWWNHTGRTYRDVYLGPLGGDMALPAKELSEPHAVPYGEDGAPIFIGHYWLSGKAKALGPKVACVDYSVAEAHGKLVAYCWTGEQTTEDRNFVWVERQEPAD